MDFPVLFVLAYPGLPTGHPGHVRRPQPARHAWDPGRSGRHRGGGPGEKGVCMQG